jgi:EAL domain-containing protein (putative c-di-GMP-specific phosphodiesterase class I)
MGTGSLLIDHPSLAREFDERDEAFADTLAMPGREALLAQPMRAVSAPIELDRAMGGEAAAQRAWNALFRTIQARARTPAGAEPASRAPAPAVPQEPAPDPERQALVRDLMHSLHGDDFYPVFQTIVDAQGRTLGVEVLARWAHPVRGLVMPATFVPLAEELGVMRTIESRMIEAACRHLAGWHAVGLGHLFASINLSREQLAAPHLYGEIAEALARHRLKPAALMIEIDETIVRAHPEAAAALLAGLQARGLRTALDNFASGALWTLARLACDHVKVDTARLRPLHGDAALGEYLRSTDALARARGGSAIACGIETPAQHEAAAALGLRMLQGFLFSTPQATIEIDWSATTGGTTSP